MYKIGRMIGAKLHQRFISDYRIEALSRYLGDLLPEGIFLSGLDVGCGYGEISCRLQEANPKVKMQGVEVKKRDKCLISVVQFAGRELPFTDKSFDFVLLIDVLHHEKEQEPLLQECARVARRFIIIKDHYVENRWDRWRLKFMDWVGNYAYSVSLPYQYRSRDEWRRVFEELNLAPIKTIEGLRLYPRIATGIFDSKLHFVSVLKSVN